MHLLLLLLKNLKQQQIREKFKKFFGKYNSPASLLRKLQVPNANKAEKWEADDMAILFEKKSASFNKNLPLSPTSSMKQAILTDNGHILKSSWQERKFIHSVVIIRTLKNHF